MLVLQKALIIFILLFPFTNRILYSQFSAMLISDQKNAPTGKFIFSNNKYRLENLDHPAKIFLISDTETNQTIIFNPGDSTYIKKNRYKTPSDPIATWELFCNNLTEREAGKDTINGLECRKTIYNKLSSGKEVIKVILWKSLKYDIPVRINYNLPHTEGFFELTEIIEKPVKPGVYEIPPFYKERKTKR